MGLMNNKNVDKYQYKEQPTKGYRRAPCGSILIFMVGSQLQTRWKFMIVQINFKTRPLGGEKKKNLKRQKGGLDMDSFLRRSFFLK